MPGQKGSRDVTTKPDSLLDCNGRRPELEAKVIALLLPPPVSIESYFLLFSYMKVFRVVELWPILKGLIGVHSRVNSVQMIG